jgi:hypothetical protein
LIPVVANNVTKAMARKFFIILRFGSCLRVYDLLQRVSILKKGKNTMKKNILMAIAVLATLGSLNQNSFGGSTGEGKSGTCGDKGSGCDGRDVILPGDTSGTGSSTDCNNNGSQHVLCGSFYTDGSAGE